MGSKNCNIQLIYTCCSISKGTCSVYLSADGDSDKGNRCQSIQGTETFKTRHMTGYVVMHVGQQARELTLLSFLCYISRILHSSA